MSNAIVNSVCKRSLAVPVSRNCFKVFVQLPYKEAGATASAPEVPPEQSLPVSKRENAFDSSSKKLRKFLSDTAHSALIWWGQLEQHPDPKSWQRRVYQYSRQLMQRTDVDETILRRLGALASQKADLVIRRPDCLSHEQIISNLSQLKEKRQKHKRLFVASLLLTPFTAAMGVLPGPNVFLYWNAYRAWSHYGAMNGSTYLEQLLDRESVLTESCEHLSGYWRRGLKGLASDTDPVDDQFIKDMQVGMELDGEFDLFMHQAIYSLKKL